MVNAGSAVLLVRKISVLPDSESLNRMRRRCSAYIPHIGGRICGQLSEGKD